ncbi:MAG: segregation/condensation protein A [Blastocatellia bacterium]|nr:segregation/condensation protein A [Blastocatellia bacterium]MBL8195323.1 segregation/condensation protein A [Blastocatellia bacterium]
MSLSLVNDLNAFSNTPYKIKLDIFEGPLDLLLYLIKKEELDIYDIPIAHITEEYLKYIQLMQELDIDLASEFLVMAATLIHIKSKMLLPVINESSELENLEDPRQELVKQLLEHKKFKSAAEMLWSRVQVEQNVFVRAAIETDSENPEVAATVFDLVSAFQKILTRRKEQIAVEIANDKLTLAQKIVEIKSLLKNHLQINVTNLMEAALSKAEIIIIFLAILELVKESVIGLMQTETFGEIIATRIDIKKYDSLATQANN